MEKNYENLDIDFPDDGIARITMNRPERLNALTLGLVDDLHSALDLSLIHISEPTRPY